jgi:hypothetical protein
LAVNRWIDHRRNREIAFAGSGSNWNRRARLVDYGIDRNGRRVHRDNDRKFAVGRRELCRWLDNVDYWSRFAAIDRKNDIWQKSLIFASGFRVFDLLFSELTNNLAFKSKNDCTLSQSFFSFEMHPAGVEPTTS